MSTYLIINFLIIIFPLLLSLLPRYRSFYQHWRQWLGATVSVGLVFIIWDVVVTQAGHWQFNPSQVLTYRLMHLPIEEWCFFITVPFSCLFLYQGLKKYFPQTLKNQVITKMLMLILILLLAVTVVFYPKPYTLLVVSVAVLTGLMILKFNLQLFQTKAYWFYSGLGLGLFVIFNSWLTAIPVVVYNYQVILNIRMGTIPIEDFLYNWSLLTLYAGFYDLIGRRYEHKK